MKFKPQLLSFFMAIYFSMILVQGMRYLISPPEIGEILALERTKERAAVTHKHTQIKLFFVKAVSYCQD